MLQFSEAVFKGKIVAFQYPVAILHSSEIAL
jgi:hypothetical protein